MTYYKPLHVIHWEHNYPNDFTLNASAEPILTVNPLVHVTTKAKMGLQFRWTLRIASKKEHILSFIAEQDFFFDDILNVAEPVLWNCVRTSHAYYREEFDKRKELLGLNFIIVPVKKRHVDFQEVMSFLRD
jgi:hypothetical protein